MESSAHLLPQDPDDMYRDPSFFRQIKGFHYGTDRFDVRSLSISSGGDSQSDFSQMREHCADQAEKLAKQPICANDSLRDENHWVRKISNNSLFVVPPPLF